MEYQSFGRAHRPKGAYINHALKVMLVLAVGAWLLYQIKHSRNNTEIYSDQTQLHGGHGAILLGRKGTPSWLDQIDFPDSGNVDSARQAIESSSGKDDESGAKKDKAEELAHINEKFSTREENEVGLEPESQHEVSSKKTYKDSSKKKSEKVGVKLRRSESNHTEHVNGKNQNIPIINYSKSSSKEEVQLREQLNEVQVRKNATSDFSEKENDRDEGSRIRLKKTRMHKNVPDNDTNADLTEEIDNVQSFHDENGVPPDVNETEIVFGQAHIKHEEKNSNVNKGRKHIYEVTYVEHNTVEVNLEASEKDTNEEINTGSITRVDMSGMKYNSEIGEGDS
ncbi:hypothetical protein VNO78_10159 [Psophocarpus tetragonolobus]|uniref:Uncharacterized protein n=1 Tax=Psophocarpus tetragonolobus TaxID=3891 RepID=A0AAN9SJD2_PSOTE